jgi:hypothetical protein
MSLHFAPYFSLELIALLAAVAVSGLAVLLYLRGVKNWLALGLRTLALGAIIFALANPTLLQEERNPLPGIVTLVIDDSPSQALGGRAEDTAGIIAGVEERLQRLGNLTVRTSHVSKNSATAELDGGTALFSTLRDATTDIPNDQNAGAILITDGLSHDEAKIAQRAMEFPVHALISGNDEEFDRRIKVRQAPRFGLVGKNQTIQFELVESGLGSGGPVPVVIAVDGTELQRLSVNPGALLDVDIPIDHAGDNLITISAGVGPNELTSVNNQAVLTVEGIRENLRVLLVTGAPHSGGRNWRNLLKSDASVDLVQFTILRPPEKQDGTPIFELALIGFPTRELFTEKIDQFDLIIFDRYQRRRILPYLYFDNIAQYVENGGALLVAAGPEFASPASIYETPLSPVLPVVPTGAIHEELFRPAVTEPGTRHPVTQALEKDKPAEQWGRWGRQIQASAPEGHVVMTGVTQDPLLVLNKIGDGRVGVLLSDHAWLWSKGVDGGGPHLDLLRRIAHWLMKEPELEEEALTAQQTGDTLRFSRQTMSENVGELEIETPTGERILVPMAKRSAGIYDADFTPDTFGLYQISDGALRRLIYFGTPNPIEFEEVVSTPRFLAASLGSAGNFVGRAAPSAQREVPQIRAINPRETMHGTDWIGLRKTTASRLISVREIELFEGALALALLLLLASATWYREGR